MHKPPKKINWFFGYRTQSSMKSNKAWEFTQKRSSKLLFFSGLTVLPISIIPMLFALNKTENFINNIGCIVVLFQLFPFIFIIISTQLALKKNFDSDGNRK